MKEISIMVTIELKVQECPSAVLRINLHRQALLQRITER